MVQQFDQRSAAFYARVRRSGRFLVGLVILLSLVSWALLLYASTHPFDQLPRWAGPVDGVVAFLVMILTVVIERSFHGQIPEHLKQLAYSLVIYLVPTLLVLLFVLQKQLIWNTLLPGLAWRMYSLLLVLPASLAAFRSPSSTP